MKIRTQFHYNTGIIFVEMSLFVIEQPNSSVTILKKCFIKIVNILNILKNRPVEVDNGHIK